MGKMQFAALAAGAILCVAAMSARAQDLPGSHDPAFLKRYEGSQIVRYAVRPFDRYLLAAVDPDKPDPGWKFDEAEGQITRILYLEPPGHSMLEILRNYQAALRDAGFTQTIELSHDINSRKTFMDTMYNQGVGADDNPLHHPFYDWNRSVGFVGAKGQQDGKDVTVSILLNEYSDAFKVGFAGNPKPVEVQSGQVLAVVDVVVAKANESHMVTVKAPAPAAATPAPAPPAPDVAGGRDPAFLKRYEGSRIVRYVAKPFDRYQLAALDPDKPDPGWKFEEIEGQITRIIYLEPPGHGTLEILRNYQSALREAGLTQTIEFSRGINSIKGFMSTVYNQGANPDDNPLHAPFYDWNKTAGYLAAKGQQDGKDVAVSILFNEYNDNYKLTFAGNAKPVDVQLGQVVAIVDVVVSKAIDIRMVTVKAADMADALATKGEIDLYGILFDVDKTDIKPESAKTLDEVASLLKIDRSLRLEISGHTDNTGTPEHNLKLSDGRAHAVVDVLVKKYGIDAGRMEAKGYGDTKPVADNATDAGKAKNRRVELRKL